MLALIGTLLVAAVALEHVYILYLEMFAWTAPRTLRVFGTTPAFAQESRALAANQGLYNGFLAAGLLWGIAHPQPAVGLQIQLFFLICVLVAAVYGGLSVKRSIMVVQGGPAALALLAVIARMAL